MEWKELAEELNLQEVELKALVDLLAQDRTAWKAVKNQIYIIREREDAIVHKGLKWEHVLRAQGACLALEELMDRIESIVQRVAEEDMK